MRPAVTNWLSTEEALGDQGWARRAVSRVSRSAVVGVGGVG